MGAGAHPNRENQAIQGGWHTGIAVARPLDTTHTHTPALMLTSNVFSSTSTRNRRRSGARAPFTARTTRTTHRPSPNLRLVPTTIPASIALAA